MQMLRVFRLIAFSPVFFVGIAEAAEAPIFELWVVSPDKKTPVQFRGIETSIPLSKTTQWQCKFKTESTSQPFARGIISCTSNGNHERIGASQTIRCPASAKSAAKLLRVDSNAPEIRQLYMMATRDFVLSEDEGQSPLKFMIGCATPNVRVLKGAKK